MLRRMRNALVDNVCAGAAQNHSPYGQSDVSTVSFIKPATNPIKSAALTIAIP